MPYTESVKAFIRVVSTTLAVIMLLLLGAVTVLVLAPDETRKSWLVAVAGYSLNREVTIDGEFRLELGSRIALHASELAVANADWSTHPDMFRVRQLDTTVSLWPLLRGTLEFDLFLNLPELMLETSESGTGNWQFGQAAGEATRFNLALAPREISITDGRFFYREYGIQKQDETEIKSLHLVALKNRQSLDLEGHFNDLPLSLKSERASGPEVAPGAASQLSVRGQLGRLNIQADGTVAQTAGESELELDLAIAVDSPSLRFLNGQLGQVLPDLGPLKGQARLHGPINSPALEEISASVDSTRGKIKASGEISDILNLRGFDLEVDTETSNLTELLNAFYLDPTLVLPPTVQAKGKLSGNWPALMLDNIEGKATDGDSNVLVSGRINDLPGLDQIELLVKLHTPSLADLAPYQHYRAIELPGIGPVSGSGRITARKGTWSASEVQIDVNNESGWIQYKAEVPDLLNWYGLDSELKAKLDSLDSLHLPDLPAGAGELGQVELQIALKEAPPDSGELVFRGEASTGKLRLAAAGNLNELAGVDGIVFDFELTADKLSDMGVLLHRKLPDTGPMQISGKLINQGDVIKLEKLQARAGNSDLAGHFAFAFGDNSKPGAEVLGGILTSDTLDLSELLPEWRASEIAVLEDQEMIEASEDPAIPDDKRLFSTAPLPVAQMRQYRTRIQFDAGKVITRRYLKLEEVKLVFDLADGLLLAGPFTAKTEGQPLSMEMMLDASQSPAAFTLSAHADDLSIRHLGPAATEPKRQNGKMSFHVDVNGQGDSPAAIMASLDGTATLGIADIHLANASANALGMSLLSKLNPVEEQDDPNALECAAVYFAIKEGMATTPRGLAARFKEVTWLGNGKVDLATERIQISASPRARKGLGINLNQFAKLVLLGGTMAQPQMQINPQGVVGAYASYAAAISTGGLSLLLESLLDKSAANERVCMQVMNPREATESGTSGDSPAGEAQPSAESREPDSLLDQD